MNDAALPPLRPLGIGQLLDRAIRLYRQNFLTFIGIIAIVQIPLVLADLVFSLLAFSDIFPFLDDPWAEPAGPAELFSLVSLAGLAGVVVTAMLSLALLYGLATAALTHAVADSYLGRPTSISSAYRRIGRSWISLVGALLLVILLIMLLAIWWVAVPCLGWLTGLGMIIFVSFVVTPMLAPIVVLERQGAAQALARSWDLVRRRFWWTLGFIFILIIFGQVIITGPTLLVNLLFELFLLDTLTGVAPGGIFALQTTVQSLTTMFFSLIYLPIQLGGITLMYFDLRVRTEGFDLALLAQTALEGEVELSEMQALIPKPAQSAMPTMNEWSYFFLISIVPLAIFVFFSILLSSLMMALIMGAM